MTDHQSRLEAHRLRIEREQPNEQEQPDRLAGFRKMRKFPKPRRSSRSDSTVLLAALDRFNLMARNPGWTL